MKRSFLLLLFCCLTINAQDEKALPDSPKLPEEVLQYFEEIKVTAATMTCECINENKETSDLRKALENCGQELSDILEKKYGPMFENEAIKKAFADPDLAKQMGEYMNSLPEYISNYLMNDCTVVKEIGLREERPRFEKICQEKVGEIFLGSINETPLCDCLLEIMMEELTNDPDYFSEDKTKKELINGLISSDLIFVGFDQCFDANVTKIGTEETIRISEGYLETLKQMTTLEFEKEGLNQDYDLDLYCDCFYGKLMKKITSKEWFEYVADSNKKVEKIEKKCFKKSKK